MQINSNMVKLILTQLLLLLCARLHFTFGVQLIITKFDILTTNKDTLVLKQRMNSGNAAQCYSSCKRLSGQTGRSVVHFSSESESCWCFEAEYFYQFDANQHLHLSVYAYDRKLA